MEKVKGVPVKGTVVPEAAPQMLRADEDSGAAAAAAGSTHVPVAASTTCPSYATAQLLHEHVQPCTAQLGPTHV